MIVEHNVVLEGNIIRTSKSIDFKYDVLISINGILSLYSDTKDIDRLMLEPNIVLVRDDLLNLLDEEDTISITYTELKDKVPIFRDYEKASKYLVI